MAGIVERQRLAEQAVNLLVIHLEATCDDGSKMPKHEMETIQIGAVLVDLDSLAVCDEFQTFVKPIRHPVLTEFCTKLTTVRQADVASAPPFPEAIARLLTFVGARAALFCSWGDHVPEQLAQDALHHGIELRLGAHSNLMQPFTAEERTRKAFDLDGALERVGLTFEGARHRGIDEACNITRLLPWILGRKAFPQDDESVRSGWFALAQTRRQGVGQRDLIWLVSLDPRLHGVVARALIKRWRLLGSARPPNCACGTALARADASIAGIADGKLRGARALRRAESAHQQYDRVNHCAHDDGFVEAPPARRAEPR